MFTYVHLIKQNGHAPNPNVQAEVVVRGTCVAVEDPRKVDRPTTTRPGVGELEFGATYFCK